jgi:hypothetical protein
MIAREVFPQPVRSANAGQKASAAFRLGHSPFAGMDTQFGQRAVIIGCKGMGKSAGKEFQNGQ